MSREIWNTDSVQVHTGHKPEIDPGSSPGFFYFSIKGTQTVQSVTYVVETNVLNLPASVTSMDVTRADRLIANKLTIAQLAVQEGITVMAAKKWLKRLCAKLGVKMPPRRPAKNESGQIQRLDEFLYPLGYRSLN